MPKHRQITTSLHCVISPESADGFTAAADPDCRLCRAVRVMCLSDWECVGESALGEISGSLPRLNIVERIMGNEKG